MDDLPAETRVRLIRRETGRLIKEAFSSDYAAAVCTGKSNTQVNRWHAPGNADVIPLVCLMELEAVAKRPLVTELLCKMNGGLFVPHINLAADEGTAEWLAMQLSKELGDVSGAIATALADDRQIDAAEAAGVLAQLEDLERAAAQLRGLMERIVRADGKGERAQ